MCKREIIAGRQRINQAGGAEAQLVCLEEGLAKFTLLHIEAWCDQKRISYPTNIQIDHRHNVFRSKTLDIGAASDLSELFEIEKDDIYWEWRRTVKSTAKPSQEHTDSRPIIIGPSAAWNTVVMGSNHETLRRFLSKPDHNIFWSVIGRVLTEEDKWTIHLTKQSQQFIATR